MEFRIADTFVDALGRLPAQEQKAAKTSAFDLQINLSSPGLKFHRVSKSKDPHFWSVRVNDDLRIIVHKTADSMLLAYVDHHNKAYAWAERRRIEAHPRTGAVQIVEVRERVRETNRPAVARMMLAPEAMLSVPAPAPRPFAALGDDDLLAVGVPPDWLAPVRAATEDGFFDLATHLPAEAAEALLDYAATGRLPQPPPAAPPADPFAHPDAQRRFRTVESRAELQAALDAPWERWAVFLHPSQRGVVDRVFAGPARVAGSAGTGKTVVALHRVARLARAAPEGRVLLATFSEVLAEALARKLAVLTAGDEALAARITVASWDRLAEDLYQRALGGRPRIAGSAEIRAALVAAARSQGVDTFPDRFLVSEFVKVVDAWQVASADAYAGLPRGGRGSRLGARQRERLWPIFAAARTALRAEGLLTWPEVAAAVAAAFGEGGDKPFTHIVVDEAQDLGVPELRMLRALAAEREDALFFAGDLGQRIFQPPFSWKSLGIDVRGRSTTLKVNYRTSQQIREAADRLLPGTLRDLDGREETRSGTISVFEGPVPVIVRATDPGGETAAAAAFIASARADGIAPEEIGVFVRDHAQLDRARRAVEAAGLAAVEAGARAAGREGLVPIGTLHLAKGLEFKAVLVLACDAQALPLQRRIDEAVDEADLDEIYETERRLFYVACTRARDRLFVAGVEPASEFLDDLERR